ncbi:MAG TPA: sensor histidine kinase [Bacteroidales bacterium]|nr:sensor histidine kinase [Bacteroidales bacterium]
MTDAAVNKSRVISILIIRLSFCLLCLIADQSCTNRNVDGADDGQLMQATNDSLFREIHKQLYDNPSTARDGAFQILDSLGSDDQVLKILSLKYIGSSYVLETNYSEGIKHYNEALAIAEEIGLYSEIANINNNLGVIYNEIGSYKNAYIHLVEALKNYDLSKNQDQKVAALNNIGLTYLYLKNYEKALSFFNEALNPQIQSRDTILIASVLNNIALCYISENKPDSALRYLGRSIGISGRINNKYGLCISHQLEGNAYLSLGLTDKAFEAYRLSENIARETRLSYQLAVAQLGIARVLLSLERPDDALNTAFEVMKMAEDQNSLVLKSDTHKILSDIYSEISNFGKALLHYREHVQAQQEVVNQTVIHQVYDVELNYLNQLNKLQQLELDKKELALSKKNNLLFFIILLSVFLFIGFYLAYRNHRHKQKASFQKAIIELTEKKSDAVLEAEIQERKRIGQELHDSLGHLLSLAGLHASVLHKRKDLEEEKRKELLESLMKSIDDAFDEVRNISHNLAPSLLSERGLEGALKSISDKVNQSTKLSMSFDTFGLSGKMDALIENTLFRTLQEIVNNTIKHADATKLFIQIAKGEHEITLIAEDNGKGFDAQNITSHPSYGLSHMKSRIEKHNGTLFIDSNKNRGTIISILIPLNDKTNGKKTG